ncbi:MAG TPA: thermonuclease family protein [Mycobacteriales bacterium]|nr:thermonuclease family protein [Mycobacteriales bacterium]
MRRVAAVIIVLALAVAIRVEWGGRGAPAAPPVIDPGSVESPTVPADAFAAVVIRVVDGDTFLARRSSGSSTLRVRIIGADTPETVKPGVAVRCYGPQASAFTKHLLPRGTSVRAAYEPGGETDRYGRQLWDVWLPDGRFLESVLVDAGAARAYPFAPQLEHASLLADLQRQAEAGARGLWGPPCRGRSFG